MWLTQRKLSIYYNVVGARKVAIAKKLILDLKIIGQETKYPFSLHFEQIWKPKSGGKEVSMPLKDGLLFATFKANAIKWR